MYKIGRILLWVCVGSVCSYGQTPYFQQYFLLRKNQPVQIHTMFQDSEGVLWFGTDKGLFRFNGLEYKRYTTSDSLPDNNITAIAQDSVKRIWIGCRNGKIAILENDTIRNFVTQEGDAAGEVSSILFDSKGVLWFSTHDDGLYYYRNGRLYRLDEDEGMPDMFVYTVTEDGDGNVWAGTDRGAVMCSVENSGELKLKIIDYKNGLPDNIIKKILPVDSDHVWMATEDSGILSYNIPSGKIESVIPDWHHGTVSDFLLIKNKLWIATRKSGIIAHDLTMGKTSVYKYGDALSGVKINTLLKDREGSIWIGSQTGLIRTPGDYVTFMETFDLKDPNILALTVDQQDAVWFSSRAGLFRKQLDEPGTSGVEKPLEKSPYKNYTVISLYTDVQGYVWAGLYGEGVLRIDPSSGGIQHFQNELRNGNVLSITGKGNILWLATLGGGTRVDLSGSRLLFENFSSKDGLVSDFIYQVFVDSKSRVWFGTDGKGAVMFDGHEYHHYKTRLADKVVFGFAEDSNGMIWANVQGEGLYYLQDSVFMAVGNTVPFRDSNINCLTADSNGNVIVMHDLGIDVYNVRKNVIHFLGEEAGLHNKIPNLNAVTKDKDGRLLFGTDEGVVRYEPFDIIDMSRPKPVIREVKVQDKPVDFLSDLRLEYDQNNMIIYFFGLWYQNPTNLNFQYRLDQYNTDWITSHDFSATYSSLPPGDYTFRVRVSDSLDFTRSDQATFSFVIYPPFWKTTSFYTLCLVLMITITYGVIKVRERQLKEDKRILEEKVRERTREIQIKNEEIQAQNEEILSQAEEIQGINDNLELLVQERTIELERKNKALEEYAFINAHQLRAPLASILGLIHLVKKTDLSDKEREIVMRLEDSAQKLEAVVRNITITIEKGDSNSK